MSTLRTTIERLAYGGEGVAHSDDGKTLFVTGGCPGDVVEASVDISKPTFCKAHVQTVLEPSPHRIAPRCPFSDVCGGCPWQHISYEHQLEAKRMQVVDALTRIAHFDASNVESLVQETVASEKEWGYRNKVEFQAGIQNGKLALGLHGHAGGFVPIPHCLLLPEGYADSPKALGGVLRYVLGSDDLGLERVGIRVSKRTGDAELALWTTSHPFPRKHLAKVANDAKSFSSIVRVVLKGSQKQRKVSNVEAIGGNGYWRERIGEELLKVSAPSFFQVNTASAEKLVNTVIKLLGDVPPSTESRSALDLYSGCGTFTLPLVRAGFQTTAVESLGSSVRDLRRNLEDCRADARVVGGDVARELPHLMPCEVAIIDPPRNGLAPDVVETLCNMPLPRLMYVSCNPTTLARDLRKLVDEAYTIDTVIPLDLFPQSYHVETVVSMTRTR